MRNVSAIVAILTLIGCGPTSRATADESPSDVAKTEQQDIYRVKVERRDAPAGFFLRKPTESDKAREVQDIEANFQQFMESDQTVRGTYRYLESGKIVVVEKIAYMDAGPRYDNKKGPIYANYMTVRDGKLVSILCMPHEPIASVPVASSNCAREIGLALGPDVLALIRSESGGE